MDGIKATIATHKGTQYCPEHNRRDEKVCSKEQHIDLSRPHENWIDIDVRTAFDSIFGSAVEKYNSRQKRADRKIVDYYEKIKTDRKHQPVQELIVGVYYENYDAELSKKVLREFVDTWAKRNPSLHIIGAYYHDDEQSKKGPHVHIDYIPVGSGYTRGLSIQCSQERALNEIGFFSKGKHGEGLASTQWIHRENETLEKICNEHGISVVHLLTGDSHLKTNSYKKLQDEKVKTEEKIKCLERESDEIESNNIILNSRNHSIENELKEKTSMIEKCKIPPILPTVFKDKRSNVLIDKNSYEALQQRSKFVSEARVAVKNLKHNNNCYIQRINNLESENAVLKNDINSLNNENLLYKNAYKIALFHINRIKTGLKSESHKLPLLSSICDEIIEFGSDIAKLNSKKTHDNQNKNIER